eukprot:Gb_33195 [translate_table: standard]
MNQYHIYEAIGRGKNSTVYKGRKKKTIEYYAIKSVDKSQKSKVLQEVRTLHSLDHPNVLKFYAWYETSAHLWLVLEYCVGGDLLTLLRQDSRLPEESIHDFARDLLQALQFLHSKGVIYCDLKPSNILLDENGRLKLCDFGLARRLSDISKSSVSQLPQAKRGTPCYMAPELFQEGGVHSFASDLWALGCVLYECYAGRPPFVANEFTQLVKSVISDPTPPLRNNPSKEFVDLVNCLLVKDPAERMQWSELREHAFWRTTFKVLPLPSQPAFNNLIQLSSKSTPSDTCPRNAENSLSEKDKGSKNSKQSSHGAHMQNENTVHTKGLGTPTKDVRNMENTQNHRIKISSGVAEGQPLKETSARTNAGVNLLRLSKIVKTNLQRETEGDNYRKPLPKNRGNDSDVKIENNDQELDFAENAESDAHDENDVSENSVSATAVSEGKISVQTPSANASQDAQEQEENHTNMLSPNLVQDSNGNEQDCSKAVEEGTRLEQQEVAATPPGVGHQRRAQRSAGIVAELGKGVSGYPAPADPCKPSISLSQALWHPSDLSVRPIMLSRKNEKVSEHMLDVRLLPFDTIPSSEFLKLPSDQLDAFVSRIVTSINGNTTLSEKQNTLRYLETLSSNVDAANILTNGPVMFTLVKMLRISKPVVLRVQLVSVMGLLIRHATLIEDEVASSGIISVLTDGLRDKQEKVRRFAMAALGELLFYISTQSENSPRSAVCQESPAKDGRSSSTWQVPSALIGLISSILRKGEDDATQLYALKTIENIASQGGDWAARFTSYEVIGNLCYIFKAPGKQESLRITAGSCLVRLVRFSPPNIQLVLEKLTFKELVAGLAKGSQREQQININLLNMALLGSNMINNMGKHLLSLLEEKTLVPSLVSLLEQAAEVLRGKAFICAALLCKINRRWLPSLCNAKVLPAMERLTKEKDAYVQQCMEALVQIVASVVPGILDSITSDIQQLSNGKRPGLAATPHTGRVQSRSSIHLFPVVFHLFSSPVFKQRIVSGQVLHQLALFMKRLETASFQGRDDFQLTLLRILELVGQESSVLLEFSEIFISQVLPSLAVLYKNNTDGDARFLCLKILFDVLVVFLNDISDSHSNKNNAKAEDLKLISEKHFLPLYPTLIEDEDPIPMYAQKLLVMLLDLKCIKISDILQLKLVSQFFEFLLEDLSTANVNNVRLCLLLASASEVETKILSELRVVKRVGALLEFVNAKEMEDFLEPTLSLCRSLLMRSTGKGNLGNMPGTPGNDIMKVGSINDQESVITDITDFGSYIAVFLELCGNHEVQIADLAAECLVLFTKAAPKEASFNVLSNLACIGMVLESCSSRQNSSFLSQLLQRLLYALCVACKEQRSLQMNATMPSLSVSDIMRVEAIVSNFRSSSIPRVAEAALDAVLELQLLPHGT